MQILTANHWTTVRKPLGEEEYQLTQTPQRFQRLSHQPKSIYISWSITPSIYVAENCLVWPQWEKMCLILKRLYAPGMERLASEWVWVCV